MGPRITLIKRIMAAHEHYHYTDCLPGRVIDITPSTASDKWLLNANLDDIDPAMGHCKGMEIASWLADNTRNDVCYVIIDDEEVCLKSQIPHFIQTNPYEGITRDIADRVIAILNKSTFPQPQ